MNLMKKFTTVLTVMITVAVIFLFFRGHAMAEDGKGGIVNHEPVVKELIARHGESLAEQIRRGVGQAAGLWRDGDGSADDFRAFCLNHFIASEEDRHQVFMKISRNLEILYGHFNRISLDLKVPLHLDTGALHAIDGIFGGYDVYAHLEEDFYNNKIAFITVLNFPAYSLTEKSQMGPSWSAKQWAYARLGDTFRARVPARLLQDYAAANTAADMYISRYNVYMGNLLDKKGNKPFPKDMKLLSHWNLRDEIKALYAVPGSLPKQDMIYGVMMHIIRQTIPESVVDNNKLDWDPQANKVYKDGKEIAAPPENDARYQRILDNFRALRAIDAYQPAASDTYIKRAFDDNMEIAQAEVEELFSRFVSAPQMKKIARLIRKRLKRKLRPFDIWYDGFKGRSGIPEEKLNTITRTRYPDAAAMEKDLPGILTKIGFSPEKARFLGDHIAVDPARGSGHAWGAQMKGEKARLRTRVPQSGMDYKGYNIAIHELGHNVEQTITLHDVEYYTMNGVPNTAFTEALAFMFQDRDLQLLDMEETNSLKKHLAALDAAWNMYESMGVSLLDMRIWKWMYQNPDADAHQLKKAVIDIANDVWNSYFADVMGVRDQPVLAIYSHIIAYPLYLSAYSYGYLINFQIEQHLKKEENQGKFAAEVERMFAVGRLIPQVWMKNAVGEEITIEPVLKAVDEALKHVKK